MGKSRTTLATLAAHVGVSRSTVSNAYNRPDQLSPDLRTRILEAAAELGYPGPDPAARSLRQGRAGAIGVVQGIRYAVTDPANQLMLSGVAEVCEAHGLALVLVPPSRDDGSIDVLRTTSLDGVIAHCESFGAERRRLVEHRGMAFVAIDSGETDGVDFVGIDDSGGAYAAAKHLIELGHRHFAVFTLNCLADSTAWVTARRLEGYRAAFAEHRIDDESIRLVDIGSGGRADAIGPAVALLSTDERPTAILAMSDELAVGVREAADQCGLVVPRDVSIVGYDDSPVADLFGLTTVHQDHAAKGRAAAEMLLEPSSTPRRLVLPTTLVVRASTAPPRS